MAVTISAGANGALRFRVLRLGLVGAFLAALLVGTLAYGAGTLGPARVGAFTTSYDQRLLDDPLELLLVQSDGQAFASLARDPLLARPEVFRTDAEAAYRAQRPLLPYMAWASSLGRSGWVPPALAVLSAAGAGLAVAGVARLLADRGAPARLALLVLLFPGTYMALSYCGPEPLGLGLVAWGLIAWSRGRIGLAIALLGAAGICRETLLLVPLALMLTAISERKLRPAVALAATCAPYVGWVLLLRLRLGAWPTDAGQGRLSAPLVGLVDGMVHADPSEWLYAAFCVGFGATAWAVARTDPLGMVAATHLAFAAVMGRFVWVDWNGFSRVLLPLNAVALVLIAGKVWAAPRDVVSIRDAPVPYATVT